MRSWTLTISSVPRSLLPILICVAVSAIAVGNLRSLAQSEQAHVETLFGTPPLSSDLSDTSVALSRITYDPGDTFDLDFPGPSMLYVERGELAVPEAVPGQPIVLMDSGLGNSPPIRSDSGEQVLPAGYAILVEGGRLGMTHNPGTEPTVVLAVFLVPERTGEFAAVEEATAAP